MKAKEVTLHICDSCNKEFASPYNLRRHQLTHTDEKPFQVRFCYNTLHLRMPSQTKLFLVVGRGSVGRNLFYLVTTGGGHLFSSLTC